MEIWKFTLTKIPDQIPYRKGITWPDLLVGIVAAIMLGAGLVPVYFELWKRNGRVVGFSEYLLSSHWFLK